MSFNMVMKTYRHHNNTGLCIIADKLDRRNMNWKAQIDKDLEELK